MKILMCQPRFYGVEYVINPWMNIQHQPNHAKAEKQWQALTQAIRQAGAEIELIEPIQGLPDLVFTANGGFVQGNQVLLAQFRFAERQGEEIYFKNWFEQHGFQVLPPAEKRVSYEGEGDALLAGDVLFVGYGIRSSKNYFSQFERVGINKIIYCELVDPYFYHLDTAFCPLNATTALWWPGAFSESSQQIMQQHIQLIAVPQQEAKLFACNSVIIGNHVIMPAGCQVTRRKLEQLHFNVTECEMSEFIKSGGACKCLTLYLEH